MASRKRKVVVRGDWESEPLRPVQDAPPVRACVTCHGTQFWERPARYGYGWACYGCHQPPPGVEPNGLYTAPPYVQIIKPPRWVVEALAADRQEMGKLLQWRQRAGG